MVCVCHSLAAFQRRTLSSLAAVIGLSNNDAISLRSLRCVRCVGWKPRFSSKPTSRCANQNELCVLHFFDVSLQLQQQPKAKQEHN